MTDAGVVLPPEPIVGNEPAEPGTGWKFAAGFRPVRVVGVEVQYLDLDDGETEVHGGWRLGGGQVGPFYEQSSYLNVKADASVLSALLFIPEGNPSLDIYGKVGVADLNESFATSTTSIACVPIVPCTSAVYGNVHQSDLRPYVGFGARVTVWRSLAVRVEYEGIDRDVGDSFTMLSLGFSWEH